MANRYELQTKFNHLVPYSNKIQGAAHDAIQKGILDIEAQMKVHIVNNGQVDTGNMLNSCYSNMISHLRGEAGNSAAYAAYQELGYKGKAGRPFLTPAFNETVPEVIDFLKAVLGNGTS